MKTLLVCLLSMLMLTSCKKKDGGAPDPGWYPSPTNRLQLIVPSKYPTTLDSVAVVFRNPDPTNVLYSFQLRRVNPTGSILIAQDNTRSLKPNERQQINYSTKSTGRFVYGTDAIYLRLENYDTKEVYGDFKLSE